MFCMAVNSVPGLLLPVPGSRLDKTIDAPRHPLSRKWSFTLWEIRDIELKIKTLWTELRSGPSRKIYSDLLAFYTLNFTNECWSVHVTLRSRVCHAVINDTERHVTHVFYQFLPSRVLSLLPISLFSLFPVSVAARVYICSWCNFSDLLISRDTLLWLQ